MVVRATVLIPVLEQPGVTSEQAFVQVNGAICGGSSVTVMASVEGAKRRVSARVFKVIRPYIAQGTIRKCVDDDFYAPRYVESYGSFTRRADISTRGIGGLEKPSSHIRREIVQFVNQANAERPITRLLLPGEPKAVVPAYADWLKIDRNQIVTAGLDEGADFDWNYENDPPPGMGTYSLIVSQAMLEHLIDPYKHVRDLYALLDEHGDLILHTVTPGYPYHRVPIDSVRFFPDWFESVAERIGAEVRGKFIGDRRIMYRLTRPGK